MQRSVRFPWRAIGGGAVLLALVKCSFPEHDFIPAGDFDKLKHDASAQGGSGGVGGTGGICSQGGVGDCGGGGPGGTGATGGTGGTGATGGTGGTGATGGTGGTGATGGTGGTGATGGTGGTGATGGTGGTGATGGTGGTGATGGTGGTGATGGTGGTGATGGTGGTGATGGTGGTGATGGTGGTGATGGTGGTGGVDAGPPCYRVVVNEISVDGAVGADEFVELYNAGTCSVSLIGWVLKYGAASGSNPLTCWTGSLNDAGVGDSIAAGGFFVIGGTAFTGGANGTVVCSGFAATGGGVAIFDSLGGRQDSMAYGSAVSTHPFVEGTVASTIPKNQSASRSPDGTDTDNNSVDFKITARTPGASNP